MLRMLPDRVGHGTFLHPDRGGTDEILALMDKHRIPLGSISTLTKYHILICSTHLILLFIKIVLTWIMLLSMLTYVWTNIGYL